jgi:hypothetical protein
MGEERHVVPTEGGWEVKRPGTKRPSSRHATQQEAIAHAREILRNRGGGEIVVHMKDGRIRDKDTVFGREAGDPFPPRGRR